MANKYLIKDGIYQKFIDPNDNTNDATLEIPAGYFLPAVWVVNPSGGGSGGAVTIANGADVAQGSTTDAAVTTNANGTVVGFLRGIVTLFGSIFGTVAVLADAMANPTIGKIQSFLSLWNGATWDRWPGNTSGGFVQGNVANGVANAGNPILTGGRVVSANPSTLTVGQRADSLSNLRGFPMVAASGITTGGTDGTTGTSLQAIDGTSNTPLLAATYLSNNSTFDRQRNNHEVTVLASASRAVDTNSADQINYNARGIIVDFDMTVKGSTSVTVTIKAKDSLSGVYTTLLASAAIVATGHTQMIVYPGITVAANLDASAPVPRIWRVEITRAGGASDTYSVSNQFIL